MSIFRRVSNLFSRSRVDQEIDAELKSHIEMRPADNIAAGMSPEAARRDALLKFGNPTVSADWVVSYKTWRLQLERPSQHYAPAAQPGDGAEEPGGSELTVLHRGQNMKFSEIASPPEPPSYRAASCLRLGGDTMHFLHPSEEEKLQGNASTFSNSSLTK